MFDLPSMLGEYLLPLIIVVPLAVVVLMIAARASHQDDAPPAPPPRWQAPPWTPPSTAGQPPSAAPRAAGAEPASPFLAPLETPPVSPIAYAPTEPAALGPPIVPVSFAPTEPAPLDFAPAPAAAPAEPTAPVAPVAPPAGGGIPLLVVDDSAVVRAKLSKLLASAGYQVTVARHGGEALEQLNQHWFAVMITDLEMPEMDGFELISHVSNDLRTENLPIVAITGHESLQAKVQDAKGLFGIFKKPWNDRELLARVGVLVQLRPRP